MKDIFQGWIRFASKPSINIEQAALIPPSQHFFETPMLARFIARANNVPYGEALREVLVRQAGKVDHRFARFFGERVAYVGDIHGGNDSFYERLGKMAENPPDLLIFNGDIAGSEDYEDLQRRFYNTLVNYTKPLLASSNPLDEELLNYRAEIGEHPQTHEMVYTDTMKEGFLGIRRRELIVAGYSSDEVEQRIGALSLDNATIASEIRRYNKYVHFGHYISNLPEEIVEKLEGQLDGSVQRFVDAVVPLLNKGTHVVINRGNWDSATPTDFMPGTEKPERLPEGKRRFKVWDVLHAKEPRLTMLTGPAVVESKRAIHVVVPFDSITGLVGIDGRVSDEDLHSKFWQIALRTDSARERGKAVVLVTHGQPDWDMHFLNQQVDKRSRPNGENIAVIAGTRRLVAYLHPSEHVYGHMHEQKDEQGELIAPDVRYATKVTEDGRSIEVVEDKKDFASGQVVESLIPLQEIARSYIPRRRRLRGISPFNDQKTGRHPAIIERG